LRNAKFPPYMNCLHKAVSCFHSGAAVPELRDASKPIAFDERGRPLFGPRGFVIRWPGRPDR
jgi:hypothetical protein